MKIEGRDETLLFGVLIDKDGEYITAGAPTGQSQYEILGLMEYIKYDLLKRIDNPEAYAKADKE